MSKSTNGRVIKINPEVVKAESEKIKQLSENKDLSNKLEELKDILKESDGASVNELKDINFKLKRIETAMNLLFTRTAEFLNNKATDFVILDESIGTDASEQDK